MRRLANVSWQRILPALVATLVAASGAHAQAPAPTPAAMAIPSERYRLANGLDVILHQDRTIPIVHVNVTYHVGSGNEPPGQTGYAHLFEHLMFQGSQHLPRGQHDVVLRDIGARGANGTTNPDLTNYYQSVPAHQLETALWLESDRMGYLLLDQQALDNQREVVRNERRMRHENVAFGQELFVLAGALYPEGHPYRYLTIGLDDDLARATLDDARTFFARWYVPSNATLVLAGDFDIPTARALIQKWFGTFPASSRPRPMIPTAPTLANKVRRNLNDPLATTARIRYVWPTPAFFAPGDAELDLLATLLASDTGRLRAPLFISKALARNLSAFQSSRGLNSEFHIVVDLQPMVSVAEVDSAITGVLDTIALRGVSASELKQAVVAREALSTRSLETLAARASRLQTYAHFGREPDSVNWDLERYRKVTSAQIKDVVTRLLTDKRVEIVTIPMPTSSAAVRTSLEAARPLELDIHLPAPAPIRRPGVR